MQELFAARVARTGGQRRGTDLDGDIGAVEGVGACGIVAVGLDFNRAVVVKGNHVAGRRLDRDVIGICCQRGPFPRIGLDLSDHGLQLSRLGCLSGSGILAGGRRTGRIKPHDAAVGHQVDEEAAIDDEVAGSAGQQRRKLLAARPFRARGGGHGSQRDCKRAILVSVGAGRVVAVGDY